MLSLKTVAELEALHTNNVRESLHLEYKASGAVDKKDDRKKIEMARDVSAFANADGGQIIYGMTETDHDPAGLDSGLDPKTYPEIWFEQVIQQHVTPMIEGLKPYHVPLPSGQVAVVIDIPAAKGERQRFAPQRHRVPEIAGENQVGMIAHERRELDKQRPRAP
jgi:predicted HTH transcriptional regulator